MLLEGQMRQEPVDIAFRKFSGMLVFDVPTNPLPVRFSRASAVMVDPQNSDEVIAETGLRFLARHPHGPLIVVVQMGIHDDRSRSAPRGSSVCLECTGPRIDR